jgi:CPA2 family monovalent cation:H+ antiporter-2
MRDAFAVLFFVSIGAMLDPVRLDPVAIAATLAIVLIGKPLSALAIVLLLRYPLKTAMSVAVALAQIGEFSFILATLGKTMAIPGNPLEKIINDDVLNTLVAAAIISITLNPLLYRMVGPLEAALAKWGGKKTKKYIPDDHSSEEDEEDPEHRAVVIGYGPVGQTVTQLLLDNRITPTVIELNHETVRRLTVFGIQSIYGDATRQEVLTEAGVAKANHLILTAGSTAADEEIVRRAKELNPRIRVLARSQYVRELPKLRHAGAAEVFSGEGEVALALTVAILRHLGATPEQVDRERERVKQTFLR